MVVRLEDTSTVAENSVNINKLVVEIMGLITDVENLNVLQTKLDNIGYSFDEEYELWNFLYKGRQSYYVDDMFPRIRKKDVDNAIGNAQYTIMLDGIERFKEDWA